MIALIVCAAVLAAALIALGWLASWCWREWRDLGPEENPAPWYAPELAHDGRVQPAMPARTALLPAEFLAAPVAAPEDVPGPETEGRNPHPQPAASTTVPRAALQGEPSHRRAGDLPGVTAYASALKAAAAERRVAEAAAAAEAQAWRAELRAEAEATSPWQFLTGEWPALMANADGECRVTAMEQAGEVA